MLRETLVAVTISAGVSGMEAREEGRASFDSSMAIVALCCKGN